MCVIRWCIQSFAETVRNPWNSNICKPTHTHCQTPSVTASECLGFVIIMGSISDVSVTYRGAPIWQGRHADGHAHLVRGGERWRGGAPLLHFLSLEEIAPGPLDTTCSDGETTRSGKRGWSLKLHNVTRFWVVTMLTPIEVSYLSSIHEGCFLSSSG